MSDYISREAVVEFIRSYRCSTDVAIHMEQHLNEIPAADVRPVVWAAWRGIGKTGRIFVCSACDKTFPYKTRYCPNCGADMRPTSMSGANGEES